MLMFKHNTLIVTGKEDCEHTQAYVKRLVNKDMIEVLDVEVDSFLLERDDNGLRTMPDKIFVTPVKEITEPLLIEWLKLLAPIVGDSDYSAFPLAGRRVAVYMYAEGYLQYTTLDMAHIEFTIVDPTN